MPKESTWGPVRGQKHHARMALLPRTPLKYFIGHTFLQLLGRTGKHPVKGCGWTKFSRRGAQKKLLRREMREGFIPSGAPRVLCAPALQIVTEFLGHTLLQKRCQAILYVKKYNIVAKKN